MARGVQTLVSLLFLDLYICYIGAACRESNVDTVYNFIASHKQEHGPVWVDFASSLCACVFMEERELCVCVVGERE